MTAVSQAENALVVSHRVGLSTAIPFASSLVGSGETVRIYCLGDFADQARLLSPDVVEVVDSRGVSVPRWSALAKKAVFALSNFDPGANSDQRQTFDHRSSGGAQLREGILKRTRRVAPRRLNNAAGALGDLARGPISEPNIWVVSFLTEPTLALGRRHKVITLVDSWDHPVRRTAGYRSDVVVGWNQDLANDWADIQGAGAAIAGAPLKLRYAADRYPIEACEDRRFMFAVGTSAHTPDWQASELRLAELVCAAAGDAGWEVLLKLKPTGGQHDWIAFSERWPNVQISDEADAPGPMDYFLDDDYNNRRLADLVRVQFVVNSVTTFGLDAALAGVPVLQLSDLSGPGLTWLKSAQRNFHIQKYLLSRENTFPAAEGNLHQRLADWLRTPDDRAALYSESLRTWLLPESGFDAAIERALRIVKLS